MRGTLSSNAMMAATMPMIASGLQPSALKAEAGGALGRGGWVDVVGGVVQADVYRYHSRRYVPETVVAPGHVRQASPTLQKCWVRRREVKGAGEQIFQKKSAKVWHGGCRLRGGHVRWSQGTG